MPQVQLPRYSEPFFKHYRYKALHGGRGSAKSHTFAILSIMRAMAKREKILCAREYQNSIHHSVYPLIVNYIRKFKLDDFFNIQYNAIKVFNGGEFIFKGLARTLESIKSTEGITIFWGEEAQKFSKRSFDVIRPTVRVDNSEIWLNWNPELSDDPVQQLFFGPNGPPHNSLVVQANWRDNPFFPITLQEERKEMMRTDPELAKHIYEGECRSFSDAQIFKNKLFVKAFTPRKKWSGPYYGLDYGFSVDPLALVKLWIDDDERNLYIEKCIMGKEMPIRDLPRIFIRKIPEITKHMIKADHSRPETTNMLKTEPFQGQHLLIRPTHKWQQGGRKKGEIRDGIEYLNSFNKIIIHDKIEHCYNEMRKYSYKIDKKTEEVTGEIEDKFNNCADACRYALDRLIRKRLGTLDVI